MTAGTLLMNNIVKKVEKLSKGTKISKMYLSSIYSIIFMLLTDNDKIKNYSCNNGKIFFNINNLDLFSINKLKELDEMLDKYSILTEEHILFEEHRQNKIEKLKNTFMNYEKYKSELVDYININKLHTKYSLSTELTVDTHNELQQSVENMSL